MILNSNKDYSIMANQTLVQQAQQNLAAAEKEKPQAEAREAAAAVAAAAARAEYERSFRATVAAETALGNAPVQTKELQDAVTKATLEERTKSAQYRAATAELDSATLNLSQVNSQITQANTDIKSAEAAPPTGQGTSAQSIDTPVSDQVPVIDTLTPAATGLLPAPSLTVEPINPTPPATNVTSPLPLEAAPINKSPNSTNVVEASGVVPVPIYATPLDTGVETASVAPVKITTNTLVSDTDPAGLNTGDQIPGTPIAKITIVDDDQGNRLLLTQPVDVIAPKQNADAYSNEFAGVDEAIAKQKQVDIDSNANEFTGVEEAIAAQNTPVPTGSSKGLPGARTNTQAQSTAQDQANFALKQDWRVRLSLAPNSGYLYQASQVQGILQPLARTNGVVFPYTPSIQIQYNAHYDSYDLTHSNYKIQQYKNSSVDNITISCDFTAQDTAEANYLLAVIHFFRSVTKMFYGQDSIPKIGTPPPLCFLTGLGSFQFDNHPLAITNFAYSLPTDVDYIRASASATTLAGVNKSPAQEPNITNQISNNRLTGSTVPITTGGVTPNPNFDNQTLIQTPSASSRTPTYVPTKMNLSISAVPIVTRNDISNRFSLRDYATGKLLQGKQNATVGIW